MEFAEQQPMKAIFLKVSSVVIFVCMSTLIKAAGEGIATGQITFYRSAFAMVPIMAWLAVRGELVASFRTENVLGHLGRGFVGKGQRKSRHLSMPTFSMYAPVGSKKASSGRGRP